MKPPHENFLCTPLVARVVSGLDLGALTQVVLRQVPQWLWIENPTFLLGDGHSATELVAAHNSYENKNVDLF